MKLYAKRITIYNRRIIMVYRTEHPKPQFERENWINLNGEWQFEIDRENTGLDRQLYENGKSLSSVINVPFCPQSKLSGIGDTDFMKSVWYKRTITVTEEQLSGRVFLHFGAVDYLSTVYINGKQIGTHKGGYVSFKFDVTDHLVAGENTICLHATDNEKSGMIPSGKQCYKKDSFGCFYTRTTGIWQTVWLELVPKNYIEKVKYYPNADEGTLTVLAWVKGDGKLTARASFEGKDCGEASVDVSCGYASFIINLTEKHLWEVGKGGLYDLTLTFCDDTVKSYFGLRSVEFRNNKFLLNGKSVFQRLVLDQGFYPDGVYTAPSDEALEHDIDLSMSLGFNGARPHEKVFEERFFYHADRKGYLLWGEYADWGLDHTRPEAIYSILPEWLEELERDFNHPSIIGWCPQNETESLKGYRPDYNVRYKQHDPLLSTVYSVTKSVDPTRPCIDSSGYYHVKTDIYDVHDYEQVVEEFAKNFADRETLGNTSSPFLEQRQRYDTSLPFFVSEYGGFVWGAHDNGWGYGKGPQTEEEFMARLKGLTDVLLDNPYVFGYCYTQLYDVEQEQNGLCTYERKPKFPPEQIHSILAKKAAIED